MYMRRNNIVNRLYKILCIGYVRTDVPSLLLDIISATNKQCQITETSIMRSLANTAINIQKKLLYIHIYGNGDETLLIVVIMCKL
jgi:hypothetical protein